MTHASPSIRDRALKITAPNGYIIYSQVTLDVLDEVCRAHGFSVDTPLCDLTDEQMKVIFFGSEKIKVPFGKHTLESRMKWTGITAKPREEGYYKGIINVMAEILKRDKNVIGKHVRSIFSEGELNKNSVWAKFADTADCCPILFI